MIRYFILIFMSIAVIAGSIVSTFAQNSAPIITNVLAQQRPGTKLVDITYDVSDADGDTLTVTVRIYSESGSTYTLNAASKWGVLSGLGKSIVWDAGADYSGKYGTDFQIKVIADDGHGGTLTDIDGNGYQTVFIGDQEWMVENLKVTHYSNGDSIPTGLNNSAWTDLSTGAYCVYNNDESNAVTYGYLYNWYAVTDNRNLTPAGWHVSTDEDWKELEKHLGMSRTEVDDTRWWCTDEGGKLKEAGFSHWNSPNIGATNESGYSALPGGRPAAHQWFRLRRLFLVVYGDQ